MIRPPFTKQQLAEAKARVYVNGRSLSEWCVETGLDYQTAGNVLRGHTKATRGEAFRIAAALGLKPEQQITNTYTGVDRRKSKRRTADRSPATDSPVSQPQA